jgi:hypothetical protein
MFRIELGNFEKVGSRFGHICGGQGMIPKDVKRFPAFAKPASAGEARWEKIMPKLEKERRV